MNEDPNNLCYNCCCFPGSTTDTSTISCSLQCNHEDLCLQCNSLLLFLAKNIILSLEEQTHIDSLRPLFQLRFLRSIIHKRYLGKYPEDIYGKKNKNEKK